MKETIYQKLLRIQQHIDGFVKNKKAFNYSYVDGNQVLNEIRPLMNSAGLILKQEVLSMTNERYDYHTSKGNEKTEVLSCLNMRFTWVDCETGEKDENLFCANGMNDFDKGVGSALTYGERYFLLKYFHVPTDADDPDAQTKDVSNVQRKVENNLPWLNEDTPEFKGAVEKLKAGKSSIPALRGYFKISKAIETKLLEVSKINSHATAN